MPKMDTTPHLAAPVRATMTPAQLIEWRQGHGLSQQDAAHLLGMALRPYQYREAGATRGGYRVPRVDRLIELATKGLDMELRVAKMLARTETRRAGPIDEEQVASLYRTLAGHDDAK